MEDNFSEYDTPEIHGSPISDISYSIGQEIQRILLRYNSHKLVDLEDALIRAKDEGKSLAVEDPNTRNLLELAIFHTNGKVVRLMLQHTNINITNRKFRPFCKSRPGLNSCNVRPSNFLNALMNAIRFSDIELLDLLGKRTEFNVPKLNAADSITAGGDTALCFALQRKVSDDFFGKLLERFPTLLNQPCQDGLSPFLLAKKLGHKPDAKPKLIVNALCNNDRTCSNELLNTGDESNSQVAQKMMARQESGELVSSTSGQDITPRIGKDRDMIVPNGSAWGSYVLVGFSFVGLIFLLGYLICRCSKRRNKEYDYSEHILSDNSSELINELQLIHRHAKDVRTNVRAALKGQKVSIVDDVDGFIRSIIVGIKEEIDTCSSFSEINNKLDALKYCMFDLPVIERQIESILKTQISGIGITKEAKKKIVIQYFEGIQSEIAQLIVKISPISQIVQSFHPAEELALQQQQHLLMTRLGDEFNGVLKIISKFATQRGSFFPDVFISYARPSAANKHEIWVQRFLEVLCKHLGTVGVITYLDIINSGMGSSPAAHMARIRKCSHVILIGTLSLAEKELGKGHMVQTELNYIREAIRVGKQNKIVPLLLSGDYETAFPVDFLRYTTIEAFCDMGYLRCFQALIKYLFEFEGAVEYEMLWQQFNNKHLRSFPAPRDSSVNLARPGQSLPSSPNATRHGFFSANNNGGGQSSSAVQQASASTTRLRPRASALNTTPK